MRTVIRFGALGLLFPTVLIGWSLRPWGGPDAVTIRPTVLVTGVATPTQLEMARWAVGRFEAGGLRPPVVDFEFHGQGFGCRGHLGFARLGRIDICSVLVNAMSRRALLHEMSHAWLDQNTTVAIRAGFLRSRGLQTWNASDVEWRFRGYEQEIIAWALGDRILSAQIPNNDPADIGPAYELLTGRPLPHAPAT